MSVLQMLNSYQKKPIIRGLVAVLIVFLIALGIRGGQKPAEEVVKTNPTVEVTTPAQYAGGQTISLIGNVRAFTEAAVTSERAGRVTAVNVSLGQKISAGQIIATLENASERASVLQAEGQYDAAVAASAQSGVGVEQAKTALTNAENAAVSAFTSAYTTVNGVIVNNIDTFFSDPYSGVPGLRISGEGLTATANAERVAFQTILPNWQQKTISIAGNSAIDAELTFAKQQIERAIALTDTFLTIFARQSAAGRYTESELQGFSSSFTSLRASLIASKNSIESAQTGLLSARESLKRAELSASGGTNSAADAQIKQALGSLRAAQANLAKTILRSPISGTVNMLDVRTGDFISSFAQVAVVANNSALEVVTFVGDNERDVLTIGDTVLIEDTFEGIITQIAPAVDQNTRKTEVRIATDGTNIANGDTVRISKELDTNTEANTKILVPLSAVKFAAADGYLLRVEGNVLEKVEVTLGTIRGNSVEIIDGITATDAFVLDARGKLPGQKVTVATK